jgi:hypothetical protein
MSGGTSSHIRRINFPKLNQKIFVDANLGHQGIYVSLGNRRKFVNGICHQFLTVEATLLFPSVRVLEEESRCLKGQVPLQVLPITQDKLRIVGQEEDGGSLLIGKAASDRNFAGKEVLVREFADKG